MNNEHVHPIFQQMLNTFAGAATSPQPVGALATGDAAIRRAAYVSALVKHDWSAGFSDDGRKHAEERIAYAKLREEQRAIDPDFEIWNRHCHRSCINGQEYF